MRYRFLVFLGLFASTTFISPVAGAAVILGTAGISDGSDNQVDVSYVDATPPVDINESETVAGGNTVLGIVDVFGTDDGFFNLRTFGQSNHENFSRFQFSDTITNTSGVDQNVSMDFLISGGLLKTTAYEVPPQGAEFQEAGYETTISFDGTVLFESSALLRQTANPEGPFGTTNATLAESGTSLGGVLTNPALAAPSIWQFSWNDYLDTLDLGTLAAGASGELTYDVRTFVRGEFDQCGSSGCGGTEAKIGDPFDLSSIGGPSTLNFTPVAPVAEPGTMLLFLLGGLLAFAERRLGRTARDQRRA